MATLLSPEPQKPSISATLLSVIVLIPTLTGSYGSYKAAERDAGAGYNALVKTTTALQVEVAELHDNAVGCNARSALLQDKVDLQGKQLDKLLSDLKVAGEYDVPEAPESAPVPIPAMPAPLMRYEPKAPPATLQQAVQEQEKL